MIEELSKFKVNDNYDDDNQHDFEFEDEILPCSFEKKRHIETIEGNTSISKSWRIRDRMKTVSVALVVCLNVGVDPPDVFKINPCARLECWIDPSSVSPQKAMELIGVNLQKQYERWQPRARYKQSLDPTIEDVKKLCTSLRRNAKEERVLFHYNGHGVPRPTVNGEIWVFNRTYTQYIPLSIYDLQTWMGAPSIYVYDCSSAGIIINSFNQFADQHERELEQMNRGSPSSGPSMTTATATATTTTTSNILPTQANSSNTASTTITTTTTTPAPPPSTTQNPSTAPITSGTPPPPPIITPSSFKNCIQLAACAANQILPMNPQLPADLFTSCLTTPIKTALKWFTLQPNSTFVPDVSYSLIERIPGQLNDRRTMLGELNWIFTAITDTIAWNTLPRDLFQKLFRQDLLVASLFRNFLLADRIMRSYDCTPMSSPPLPSCNRHPMWAAWDMAVDLALQQLPKVLLNGVPYQNSPFFENQLSAFHVWLDSGNEERNPPEQLPIVLQVLLSQVHRLRALELLGRFLDLGPWAVNLALSVGIFPYVLKLLQASARELRPLLVFIWAKILAVDQTCQVDLVCDQGHKYFLSVLQDNTVSAEHRTQSAFVLASIVHNFPLGQTHALQGSLISICLEQIADSNDLLRQWLAICLGHLWQNFDKARWSGVRDLAHDKLYPLLLDPVPEVRASAVYALGTFISSVTQHKDRTEHANNIDRSIAMTLLTTVGNDISPMVRMELIAALQWMIILFENQFVSVFLQEPTFGSNHHHTNSLERNINMKRVSSSSSILHMSGSGPLSGSFPSFGFGSIYMRLWQGLIFLRHDPHHQVANMAKQVIDYIVNQAVDLISAKEATKENFGGSSLSLPPSPNTRTNYLGESPPVHINHLNHHNVPLNTSTSSIGASSTLIATPVQHHSKDVNASPSSNGLLVNAGIKRIMTNSGSSSATSTPIQPARSRKNSKQMMLDETAAAAAAAAANQSSTALDGGNSSSGGTNVNTDQTKPIVTTNFIPWCIGHFSSPSSQLYTHLVDRHSPEYLNKIVRFKRNERTRKVAKEQQLRAIFNRLETQSWVGRTQFHPHIVKLHPFESQIAVAYKNKIMVNDWNRTTIQSYVPAPLPAQQKPTTIHSMSTANTNNLQQTTSATTNSLSGQSTYSVSSLDFINSHDLTLILAGYDDGCIRIWRPPTENTKDSRLLTAWQAMADVTTTKCQSKFSLVTSWQQKSQTIIAAGESKFIRLWDADSELKICDIPTGSDSTVRVLTSGPNELIAVGCNDGSVRLFDKRLSPTDARIRTYRETSANILTACLRDCSEYLITGCAQGSVRLYDLRHTGSLKHFFVDGDISHMSVHTSADILACGKNCISVYGLDGRLLSTIRPHSFMGTKSGNVSSLSFHPLKVSLATGFLDSTVAVYVSEYKRHA